MFLRGLRIEAEAHHTLRRKLDKTVATESSNELIVVIKDGDYSDEESD